MDDKSEEIEAKSGDLDFILRNEELKNLTDDVTEIEKNILNEASTIVSMSSLNTIDQNMFLQPFDDLEVIDVELLDEASKVVKLLTYDDGQELEKELELSTFCLEQIMPMTKSEVELAETEESDSENKDDLATEDIIARSDIDKFLLKKKNYSGGSTDSELDLGCPLKSIIVQQTDTDDLQENTDSDIPCTDSDMAFTDSDFLCTDSDLNAAEEEEKNAEVEGVNQADKIDFNTINDRAEMSTTNFEASSIDEQLDCMENGVVSDSNKSVFKTRADMIVNDAGVLDQIIAENFPVTVASAEITDSSLGDSVVHISSAGEEASNAGSCTFSYCNNQASEVSQSQPPQNLTLEIDRRELSTSSDISEEFVQVGFSEPSADQAELSYQHRKCPDISTLSEDVEISGEFTDEMHNNRDEENNADSDLIVETKQMIEETAVVGEAEEDINININMAKNIIDSYLHGSEIVKNDQDSADEGWGEDVDLNDLETDAVSQLTEFDVVEGMELVGITKPNREQCNELQQWLEWKEKEFDTIMEGDQASPGNCFDKQEPEVGQGEIELNAVNKSPRLLLAEQKHDDEEVNDNNAEVLENVAQTLESIDEQNVFNSTEEQLLDSNSLLITPLVITPKVKRKKSSSTPKLKKKNIKSPLLRRKEIRTCINLHNACENSDVLHEIMRPAVSYGSSLNLVEAVENSPETLALEEIKPFVCPSAEANPEKPSLSGKMSTPGMPWFPWKTLSFLLLISTAAIINLDCQKHGSFSKSSTGQFLRDIGQYERVVNHYQGVVDRSREGKHWMDINLPVYTEQARRVGGPYYDVAQAKASEAWALTVLGWGKLEVAVKAGVVKVEEWVPGAQEQINKVGQAVTVGGKAMWVRAQQVGVVVQQGAVDIINGEFHWCCKWNTVKAGAAERAQIVQGQMMDAFKYVQAQINQLVK